MLSPETMLAVDELKKNVQALGGVLTCPPQSVLVAIAAEGISRDTHSFREAVNEGDADTVEREADNLVSYIWTPHHRDFVRMALFELSRAMNEATSPAIRMVIQHHQAYALESLANRVLELEQGGDDDGSGDGSAPDGDGAAAAPQPGA